MQRREFEIKQNERHIANLQNEVELETIEQKEKERRLKQLTYEIKQTKHEIR